MRTDLTKLAVTFRSFANAPKNIQLLLCREMIALVCDELLLLFLLRLLLLLMWLYNSFIEFWPSQPTLSIFYLGQEPSNLVPLTSVYLF